MTTYQVMGPNRYRDHDVGEVFEASLPPDVEERALGHGTIRIVDPAPPGIRSGAYTPPAGWHSEDASERE